MCGSCHHTSELQRFASVRAHVPAMYPWFFICFNNQIYWLIERFFREGTFQLIQNTAANTKSSLPSTGFPWVFRIVFTDYFRSSYADSVSAWPWTEILVGPGSRLVNQDDCAFAKCDVYYHKLLKKIDLVFPDLIADISRVILIASSTCPTCGRTP